MKIEGLEFIPEARRTYPRDFLASQLLGSVGSEGKGLSGLEYSLDGTLRGRDGERRLVKDALGEAIELRETRKTKPGANVTLTVDEAIQDKAEQVLAEVGETWRPRGATAIVMDPRDGALLALANWPRVNANNPGDAPDYARQNRAVAATYEPGSTFKAFTVAGALEEKEVTPETKFDLPPTIRLYDREIGESHPRGPVTLNTREILEQSSNVGAIKIGLGLGAKKLRPVGAALRLRQADRHRPARRGGRHRAPARQVLGRLDGQPPDRPGPRRHADADGGRLLRDRQRRRPAARAHRREGQRPPGSRRTRATA